MKKFINKEKIFLIIFLILFGIVFLSYKVVCTWDTSEYIGLSSVIGKSEMKEKWIGHRGIAFPLILKLLEPFDNINIALIMLYIFYCIMLITIYNLLRKFEFTNNKIGFIFMTLWCLVFIIFNPIIFGYYHVLLTEFVSMTIIALMCYLYMNWMKVEIKQDRKKIIIYMIIFSFLTMVMYHIKQSLLPIMIVFPMISGLLSVIEKRNLKNILLQVFNFVFTICIVLLSIFIWNNMMKEANVAKKTNEARFNNGFIRGMNELNLVYTEKNCDIDKISKLQLKEDDFERIKQILSKEIVGEAFKIYVDNEEKYIVSFSSDNFSIKEQIIFYLKNIIKNPKMVIDSYVITYKKIIEVDTEKPFDYFEENYSIPMRIHRPISNILDVNPEYEQYIEKYKIDRMSYNFITINYSRFQIIIISFITIFTKINLLILVFLIIILFVMYLFFQKKMQIETRKIIQMVLILYTVCFGNIMAYVMMNSSVDRYIVPGLIPMYIGDLLLIILIGIGIKNLIIKIKNIDRNEKRLYDINIINKVMKRKSKIETTNREN